MDKFLIKRKRVPEDNDPPLPNPIQKNVAQGEGESSKKTSRVVDLSNLPMDPGLRIRISDYHPNDQEIVRRKYLQNGPCQPRSHEFPQKLIGKKKRRFLPSWFTDYGSWVEYSITKDAAFCLYCYLFRSKSGEQSGADTFVVEGFSNWKKSEKFRDHIGLVNSAHNIAYRKSVDLMNQEQHIKTSMGRQEDKVRLEYRTRLTASLWTIRVLLHQGLAFRGHDESAESSNPGNFLYILRYTGKCNKEMRDVILENALENLKLTSPDIQKEIVNAAEVETTNAILLELGDALFSVLIDESRDVSVKEQMAIVLRFVDRTGCVIERFLGVVHVPNTTAIALKSALEEVFSMHGLSIMSLRGQGYDGASNMQGEFNGLKSLILKENKSAFSIHCFAHQLQLALVYVAKNHVIIALLFNMLTSVVNIVGASCRRRDILREKQKAEILVKLDNGKLSSGRGLNQETSLKRPGETRWGSYYCTIMNLILMFPSVLDVVEYVSEEGSVKEQKGEALALLNSLQTFDFVLNLFLMKNILAISNELSKALQREDQEIVNAMALVGVSKLRLQAMRDDGWESLFIDVSSFCAKHKIIIPEMGAKYIAVGRPRRGAEDITNQRHYQFGIVYTVIDMQLRELNDHFNEVNTELLLCMACLNPNNSFSTFNTQKLVRLAQMYPADFSPIELMALENQLENYIIEVRSDDDFANVIGISGLSVVMVEKGKPRIYPLVYLLITLVLLLPVATATVERAFSAMTFVKDKLRNRMTDDWMNELLVTFIEKDIFDTIEDEAIIQRFQNMGPRRGQLSKFPILNE